jgi:hypothetical protein
MQGSAARLGGGRVLLVHVSPVRTAFRPPPVLVHHLPTVVGQDLPGRSSRRGSVERVAGVVRPPDVALPM